MNWLGSRVVAHTPETCRHVNLGFVSSPRSGIIRFGTVVPCLCPGIYLPAWKNNEFQLVRLCVGVLFQTDTVVVVFVTLVRSVERST